MGATRRGSGFTAGTRASAGIASGGSGTGVPGIPTPGSDISNSIPSLTKPPGVGLGLTGQEGLGINSIQEPFGGLRSKRGAPAIESASLGIQDLEKPSTQVGLTPGSLSSQEEDSITAPSYEESSEEDKEKRRKAVEKANDFKVTVNGV